MAETIDLCEQATGNTYEEMKPEKESMMVWVDYLLARIHQNIHHPFLVNNEIATLAYLEEVMGLEIDFSRYTKKINDIYTDILNKDTKKITLNSIEIILQIGQYTGIKPSLSEQEKKKIIGNFSLSSIIESIDKPTDSLSHEYHLYVDTKEFFGISAIVDRAEIEKVADELGLKITRALGYAREGDLEKAVTASTFFENITGKKIAEFLSNTKIKECFDSILNYLITGQKKSVDSEIIQLEALLGVTRSFTPKLRKVFIDKVLPKGHENLVIAWDTIATVLGTVDESDKREFVHGLFETVYYLEGVVVMAARVRAEMGYTVQPGDFAHILCSPTTGVRTEFKKVLKDKVQHAAGEHAEIYDLFCEYAKTNQWVKEVLSDENAYKEEGYIGFLESAEKEGVLDFQVPGDRVVLQMFMEDSGVELGKKMVPLFSLWRKEFYPTSDTDTLSVEERKKILSEFFKNRIRGNRFYHWSNLDKNTVRWVLDKFDCRDIVDMVLQQELPVLVADFGNAVAICEFFGVSPADAQYTTPQLKNAVMKLILGSRNARSLSDADQARVLFSVSAKEIVGAARDEMFTRYLDAKTSPDLLPFAHINPQTVNDVELRTRALVTLEAMLKSNFFNLPVVKDFCAVFKITPDELGPRLTIVLAEELKKTAEQNSAAKLFNLLTLAEDGGVKQDLRRYFSEDEPRRSVVLYFERTLKFSRPVEWEKFVDFFEIQADEIKESIINVTKQWIGDGRAFDNVKPFLDFAQSRGISESEIVRVFSVDSKENREVVLQNVRSRLKKVSPINYIKEFIKKFDIHISELEESFYSCFQKILTETQSYRTLDFINYRDFFTQSGGVLVTEKIIGSIKTRLMKEMVALKDCKEWITLLTVSEETVQECAQGAIHQEIKLGELYKATDIKVKYEYHGNIFTKEAEDELVIGVAKRLVAELKSDEQAVAAAANCAVELGVSLELVCPVLVRKFCESKCDVGHAHLLSVIAEKAGIDLKPLLREKILDLRKVFIQNPRQLLYYAAESDGRLADIVTVLSEDSWLKEFLKIQNIQKIIAKEDNDPWKNELTPLLKFAHEEGVISHAEDQDARVLFDFVREFGMFNLPHLFRCYADLVKKRSWAAVPEETIEKLAQIGIHKDNKKFKPGPRSAVQEIKKFSADLVQTVLSDGIPKGLNTELGKEQFARLLKNTQFARGDHLEVLVEQWKKTLAVQPKAGIVPVAYKEVAVSVSETASRFKSATEIAAENQEREVKLAMFTAQQAVIDARAPLVDAVQGGTRQEFLVEFEKRKNVILERITVLLQSAEKILALPEEEFAGVVAQEVSDEGNHGITAQEIRVSIEEYQSANREIGEKIHIVTQLMSSQQETENGEMMEENNIIQAIEALASITDKSEEVCALLRMLSMYHMRRGLNDQWLNELTDSVKPDTAPAAQIKVLANFLRQYVHEHYLNEQQDPAHTNHLPLSKQCLEVLRKVWNCEQTEDTFFAIEKYAEEIIKIENDFEGKQKRRRVNMIMKPVAGLLRIHSGDIGDACYTSKHLEIAQNRYPGLHAWVFVTDRGGRQEALRGSLLGLRANEAETSTPILVARANNPKENFIRSLDADEFVVATLTETVNTARRMWEENQNEVVKSGFSVGIPMDKAGASSTNRVPVAEVYRKRWGMCKKVELIPTAETEFNGYEIWNPNDEHPTVKIWEIDENGQEKWYGKWSEVV